MILDDLNNPHIPTLSKSSIKEFIKNIEDGDIENALSFQSWLNESMLNLKDKLLKEVCDMALGRPFTIEDAGLFELAYVEGKGGCEFIAYKGKIIGEIVMFYRPVGEMINAGFEFVPKTTID